MMDNIAPATDSLRSSVSSLKKKLSNLKISIEQFDAEIDKIDIKFDKLVTQTEIYKAKLEREMGREVKRLEVELKKLRKQVSEGSMEDQPQGHPGELKIASTIGIFECLLRHICEGADDFRLISYAFLFPSVFERVVKVDDPAYLLESMPDAAHIVIERGKEYVSYIRSRCDTHVTNQEVWDLYVEEISNWWRNDALPLIYGSRDDQWDSDIPLSLVEMMMWRDDPAERPIHFSAVFDAYEIYRANKDAVYDSSGVRALDLKMFTYSQDLG